MKFVYVLGLEHSGTTLTDHLLSSEQGAIGLGEVAFYFSPEHMHYYLGRWGKRADHDLCSCGNTWSDCEFWAPLRHLNGSQSESSIESKYAELIKYFVANYGVNSVLIDSSKSLENLQLILGAREQLSLSEDDISIVYCSKDVRSFAASMIKKSGKDANLLSVFRSFNYWLGQNRKFIDFVNVCGLRHYTSVYELLCAEPDTHMDYCKSHIGMEHQGGVSPVNHTSSHIAIGNKGFTVRNRQKISYDASWKLYWQIWVSYLIHLPARRLNRQIYRDAAVQNSQ